MLVADTAPSEQSTEKAYLDMKLGLKLGVNEHALLDAAQELWASKQFDFLELYIPIDSSATDAKNWQWYDGQIILHAPHAYGGFNFAIPQLEASNLNALRLLDSFRSDLSPDKIIFHPGLEGQQSEAFRQIDLLRQKFPELHALMLIENKPALGLNGEVCLGASPKEIGAYLAHADCGFCLDIRHAVAYARWADESWRETLACFMQLNPTLWHAADGLISDYKDSHEHIGDGDIPWSEVVKLWSDETYVTIECKKESSQNLADFVIDCQRLNSLIRH